MHKRTLTSRLKPTLSLMLTTAVAASAWAQTKHVLVVSVTKGFRHDVIPAADKMLADLAKNSGQFDVDFVKSDEDMKQKMTMEALGKYDGVVFNNTTGDLPLPDREGFLNWVKSGKGFTGLHAATDTFAGFPAYTDMIGGLFKTHGEQVGVECLNQDPFHPATRHLAPRTYVFDEIYQFQKFHRERVHGLLTMDKHPNTGVPGDYAVSWCKDYGQGKVFYTSLGHRTDVIDRADCRLHILNGILWTLGVLPGDGQPQSTAYKVSADEAALGFQPLFNGVDLTGWRARNPNADKTWTVQNGMLVNEVNDKVHGTDLITEAKYRDFVVRYEYMIPKGANSGFYLRGRYEVQILDDYPACKPSNSSNGSFYNFAAPAKFASLRPGEWNQVEAVLEGNQVTVTLNGVRVHDRLTLGNPTGGELDRNVNEPGPFFLQGDHGCVAFRNLRVKPLK